MARLVSALLVCAGSIMSCAPTEKHQELTLDDFEMQTLDGKPVDLGPLKGKTIFINVWATWCRPCIQEMPTIEAAMEQLQGKDVVFLFASNEEVDYIIAFSNRKQFPFNYVRLMNLEKLAINAIPSTFIFSPSGKKIYREEGFRDWSSAESLALITGNP